MNYKIKYKRHIKNHNGDYFVNPELLKTEIEPLNFIYRQRRINKLKNHSNNSKIDSNSSSKKINYNVGMDATIKHRKRREGD